MLASRVRKLLALLFVLTAFGVFAHISHLSSPRKSIVNLESVVACLALGFLALTTTGDRSKPMPVAQPSYFWRLALLLIPFPFLITVRAPLLYDSYAHVLTASHETGQQALATFYLHPVTGDFFFRPLGYVAYWLEAKWAGWEFWRWHADGIALHLLAAFLLFLLLRKLSLSSVDSVIGALLFGLHGANPEVVSWTASRFDEWSTCFVLLALILLVNYIDKGRGITLLLASSWCALLFKEAAFCLPLLAVCVLLYRRDHIGRHQITAVAALFVLAAATLLYRTWVLGGVGGYKTAAGDPAALHFHPARFAELIFFRAWPVLFFPVNWAIPAQWWLIAGISAGLVAWMAIIVFALMPRRKMLAALAFCIAALLPASHLALMDATMLGVRVYHLALCGFALLLACCCQSVASSKTRSLIAIGLIAAQAAILVHNLLAWKNTAELAGSVCHSVPEQIDTNKPVTVEGLPQTHQGVFFLANAFSACVLLNSGKEIHLASGNAAQTLLWDGTHLKRVKQLRR